jgi:hypothetical protein
MLFIIRYKHFNGKGCERYKNHQAFTFQGEVAWLSQKFYVILQPVNLICLMLHVEGF